MFSFNDSKKKFIEQARIERENRERERESKAQLEKKENACVIIQRWWRKKTACHQGRDMVWKEWDELISAKQLSILDIYQIIGMYCFMTKREKQPDRLKQLIKQMTHNKFIPVNNNNTTAIPFYTLLIDTKYMNQTKKYLETVINQCIAQCIIFSDSNKSLLGLELAFLLHYLNPKTYQTKHVIDSHHTVESPSSTLQSTAHHLLKSTLCQFQLRDSLVQYVQYIIKLQNRSLQQEAQRLNTMTLWVATVTRLTLYPIDYAETAPGSLDMNEALMFLLTNTLIVPNIISTISSTKTVMDRLIKWTLGAAVPFLVNSSNLDNCLDKLDGNGCLFLLGNIVDLWSCSEYGEHKMLVDLALPLLRHIRSYFSDKQTTEFQHYHPLFKWSKASWGNTLHSTVFDEVINQLEYLWSRPFMDQLFYDIIHFDKVTSSSVNQKVLLFKQNKRKQSLTSKGEIALFAVEVGSIFSMYSLFISLFKSVSRTIFYRIAFTKNLMQQLWKIMTQFGPKGHMKIYLEAAQRNEIDKEPLIDVLKIFCQACSIVFM